MSDFLRPQPPARAGLRSALDEGLVVAPGVYDALGARLVERAGFDAVYMSGFATTASLIGRPDIGLLSATEMAETVRRISGAVDLPLIADADNGYGNVLNVVRTVREYERAGVCALQLEDQVFPKRCGHMSGKEVIGLTEAVAKIKAAVSARENPDTLIIARTDVAASEGIEAAIERARAFADVGADILFVEAPSSKADIERVASALEGHHLLFNWVEGGRTEGVDMAFVRETGYRLVLFPISVMLTVTHAVRDMLSTLKAESSTASISRMDSFSDAIELMGLEEMRRIESELLAE